MFRNRFGVFLKNFIFHSRSKEKQIPENINRPTYLYISLLWLKYKKYIKYTFLIKKDMLCALMLAYVKLVTSVILIKAITYWV